MCQPVIWIFTDKTVHMRVTGTRSSWESVAASFSSASVHVGYHRAWNSLLCSDLPHVSDWKATRSVAKNISTVLWQSVSYTSKQVPCRIF
jgi:hypothetical protein